MQYTSLAADDGVTGDRFGVSVSILSKRVVIGARNAGGMGAVYVYQTATTSDNNGDPLAEPIWTQVAKVIPEDGKNGDLFGFSVDMASTNSDILVVGAPRSDPEGISGAGSVYTYEAQNSGSDWTFVQKLLPDTSGRYDQFGWDVSYSDDRILVGAILDDDSGLNAGAAYLFELIDPNQYLLGWQQTNKMASPAEHAVESDAFGASVSITDKYYAVGIDTEDGFNEGAVYLYSLPEVIE